MPNMWSTGQPISATMTESPAGTVHAPGTKSYTLTATDTDTAFPNYVGPVPDTLTYAWTATKGTISGGANATWSIPADVRGQIDCQVVIDDVATMPPGDFGARNDNPITLTRGMVVPYANAQYETFATDNVYGVTKIRYKLSSVGSSCQQLKVEYQEQASSFHTCDWTPILTTGNPAQLISTTTDADGVVNQIFELSWNTLGLHNADYQLRLKADYNCNCHQTAFGSFEKTHTVNVKNLDITTCNPNGNVDYLRWDPEQNIADTTIQSTLEDNGGTTGTTLTISIYHSDRTASPTPVRTVTVTTGSNPVSTYTWDGKDGSGVTCEPGIYLFTVNATHNQTGGGDSVSDRAADAFIMEDRLLDVVDIDDKKDFQAKVQGTVTNSTITRIDPQLTILGSNTGISPLSSPSPTTISDWLQVARVDWTPEIAGSYVFLMSGKDGTPGNDKSHKARPVLGMNRPRLPWTFAVFWGEPENEYQLPAQQCYQALNSSLSGWTKRIMSIPPQPTEHNRNYIDPGTVDIPSQQRRVKLTAAANYSADIVASSFKESCRFFVTVSHGSKDGQIICQLGQDGSCLTGANAMIAPNANSSRMALLLGCWLGSGVMGSGGEFVNTLVNKGWLVIANTRAVAVEEVTNICSFFAANPKPLLHLDDIPTITTWITKANEKCSTRKSHILIDIGSMKSEQLEYNALIQLYN